MAFSKVPPRCLPCSRISAAPPKSPVPGSAVNYAEVVSHFVQAGMPEREVDAMLGPRPMTVVPVDKALAQLAGRLRIATAEAGLSLGDRCCLALRDGRPAWISHLVWKVSVCPPACCSISARR